MPEALSPQQADHAMRNWSHPALGRIRPGSPEHLQMFCGMLLDTHNPYKPAVIDWPRLSPEALQRITTLPNWDMAVQKEGSASVSVETFATTVTDPLLRKALDMDSREELRILFFVNWAAWHRRNMPAWRRPWYRLKVLAGWIYLIWQRIGMARNIDARHSTRDANFTATGATVGVKLEPAQMIDLCLAENERRMSGYDNRLLRPNTVPFLARLARRFL